MRTFLLLLCILASLWFPVSFGGVFDGICVLHLESPQYGSLARQTRTEGDVLIQFRVDADGKISSVRVLSGPSLLAKEAERNIKTWLFNQTDQQDHQIVYEFRLEKPEIYYDPQARVSFDLPRRVRVTSNLKQINP